MKLFAVRLTCAIAIFLASVGPIGPVAKRVIAAPLAAPCDTPANPIVAENCLAGNPASQWDVSGAGDPSIQGYATDISVNRGSTISFKINTNATAYHLDIYRMGYYAGNGARYVTTIMPSAPLPQTQPACVTDAGTGLVDCGNWAVSASWTVPVLSASGIYFAKIIRDDTLGASHIFFIVRDDNSHSDLVFQTSDTTWQAYNRYGGHSLYFGGPGGSGTSSDPSRAYKVSYNRPFTTRADTTEDWVFNAEYPMVRWLERNGYDVSYIAGIDTDRAGSLLLNHKVFLSVGHDEYWTANQRTNLEAARASGVHLAFFSGNEMFWKARWENSIAGSSTPYRTLVSYKETHANAPIDPLNPPTSTATWRDPRFGSPADGARPENAVTGQLFMATCCNTTMNVTAEDGQMRFWRNTSAAALASGTMITLPTGVLGYEWDSDVDNGYRPAGIVRLSASSRDGMSVLQDYGSTYLPGRATHNMTLYKYSSGALVFGAGTVQWSWGLDDQHDNISGSPSPAPNADMQQATVNLLADMGAQPATLQSGLVAATASTDTTSPVSSISSPTNGATTPAGIQVTISGTASDAGGQVGGVEVSTDGGATWHPATGRTTWTYTWTPIVTGTVTLRSRAVDDSGNLETPGAGVPITVAPGSGCPCSIWADDNTPGEPYENDGRSIEVGVKFRAEVDGQIIGLRFYKGALNTGTHVGHLWTTTGTLLGTATYTNETVSGWQQVSLAQPVTITANTTYVASYYSPDGGYAFEYAGFSAAGHDNPPLHALQAGVDGPNGVYLYDISGFPINGTTHNYWVDVVFMPALSDTTFPTVTQVIPSNGAYGVEPGTKVTATFSEALNPGTVNGTTAELRGPGGALVSSVISYNGLGYQVALSPTASLVPDSVYTATLRGGAFGIKDSHNNAMDGNYVWSFRTGTVPLAPQVGPGGPILVITTSTNKFSTYYAEILRAEGFNAFSVTDISQVTPALLSNFDIAILGELPLTGGQVATLTDWVTGGGNLIAMRPDSQLAALLGLTSTGLTLSNAYLRVNTTISPGLGIVTPTIQFHGAANRYTLNGATSVATLYSDATTATANPAVTMRNVGSNGGQAAAFTYDLARSVVYTRQGNPAWAGQDRDGLAPVRSNDMFYGNMAGDPQPDWIDFDKVAIPQADEQQRLLANLIELMNFDKKPLPRFWYFPRGEKAVVVMTGDNHGGSGIAERVNQYVSASAPNCSVSDWECIRSTFYVYVSGITNVEAVNYNSQGFEVALHVKTAVSGCADYTPASLAADFVDQLTDFFADLFGLPAPLTQRVHCVVWSDWLTQPLVEAANGMRLDANYYYYPAAWVQDRPGLFTGSGFPMRFADTDGTMVDVYQGVTHMTDESGQSYPFTTDTLLDRALGPEGYYGAFFANIHVDGDVDAEIVSGQIVSSAQSHGVPVISALQLLQWTDGRNASTFKSITWNTNKLSFDIAVGTHANGIQAMLPITSSTGALTGITRNGAPISYSPQTIKGIQYVFFSALPGSYVATYAVPTALRLHEFSARAETALPAAGWMFALVGTAVLVSVGALTRRRDG